MTTQEIQKRDQKAQQLRVLQVNEQNFFVESEEGKVAYKVVFSDQETSCTCGDFVRGVKNDPSFQCKHIMALLNSIPEEAPFLEKKKPKLDERFVTKIDGKEFVTYPGLLDLGHQKGILKILVDPIQIPKKENGDLAVCKAEVVSKTGETFIDIGDASPANTNSKVGKHLLRMASTRAIARALRSFTNIGMTCLEELGDLKDVIGDASSRAKPSQKPKSTPTEAKTKPTEKRDQPKPRERPDQAEPPQEQSPEPAKQQSNNEPDQTNGPKMSEAQRRAVMNLSRRRGISIEELEGMVAENYATTLEDLSPKDASAFIRTLQQAA